MDQQHGSSRRISWTDQLDGSAGWTSWKDQLDVSAKRISSLYLKPWPVRTFKDWPFSFYIVTASESDKGLIIVPLQLHCFFLIVFSFSPSLLGFLPIIILWIYFWPGKLSNSFPQEKFIKHSITYEVFFFLPELLCNKLCKNDLCLCFSKAWTFHYTS